MRTVKRDLALRNTRPAYLVILLGCLLVSGCDSYEQDAYVEQYVVQGYLVALEPLPTISLSTTVPIDDAYFPDQKGVRDASVVVELLDNDGREVKTFQYVNLPGTVGDYIPRSTELVLPGRTYRLTVQPSDGSSVLTAQTTVPDTMTVVRTNGDSFVYQSADQLEVTLTPSDNGGKRNNFVFSVASLEPLENNLVPLYHPDTTPFEDVEPPEVYASPILSDANYDVNADGTVTVRMPWLAVVYYGDNRVSVNVLDDAIYNFQRTQSVQQGGSTLSPGEIPNVYTNIIGGTGVFGSYARASVNFRILRSIGEGLAKTPN